VLVLVLEGWVLVLVLVLGPLVLVLVLILVCCVLDTRLVCNDTLRSFDLKR